MENNLEPIVVQIKDIIKKYNIKKAVLFGSRARGDHSPLSDYDIAIFGDALSPVDKAQIYSDIEEINTLLKIDVVFIDEYLNKVVLDNIKKDGVTIYE